MSKAKHHSMDWSVDGVQHIYLVIHGMTREQSARADIKVVCHQLLAYAPGMYMRASPDACAVRLRGPAVVRVVRDHHFVSSVCTTAVSLA